MFLCATAVIAYIVRAEIDGSTCYDQRPVQSGEVMRRLGVFVGNVDKTISSTGQKRKEIKYLKCYDDRGDEILIPFTEKGLFYEVSNGSTEKLNTLVSVSEILKRPHVCSTFAHHVFGDPPSLAYAYTGKLKFFGVIEEETVMASTLSGDCIQTPLELQTKSPIHFQIALNEARLKSTEIYADALDMCKTTGEKYVRDIKVAFTLSPSDETFMSSMDNINYSLYDTNDVTSDKISETNETNERSSSSLPSLANRSSLTLSEDLSAYDTGSELGEVDANSEFLIDWEPERPLTRARVCMDLNGATTGAISYESIRSSRTSVESEIWNRSSVSLNGTVTDVIDFI
jgi:hypothetical protein